METIEIPSKELLTADELYKFKDEKIVNQKTGVKRTKFENTEEEKTELKIALENLRKQINNYRIERISARSRAEWQYETKTIKLTKKVGKFRPSFGYTTNRQEFLRNYETLYLIEVNRLELYFNSILVSIEQAYILLLGDEDNKNYKKYFIYSRLTRLGYIVQSYENTLYNKSTNQDYIWEVLQESLNPNYKIPNSFKKEAPFNAIKQSFNNIKNNIKNYQRSDNFEAGPSSSGIDFNRKIATKHKSNINNDWVNSKKKKFSANTRPKSLLDILKNEPEYEKFQHIFDQFGTFQSPQNDSNNRHKGNRNLAIDFDLYLSKNYQKSKRNKPILRLIILRDDELFPNYTELTKCYDSQMVRVPLVIVTINASNHMQGFLHHSN